MYYPNNGQMFAAHGEKECLVTIDRFSAPIRLEVQ